MEHLFTRGHSKRGVLIVRGQTVFTFWVSESMTKGACHLKGMTLGRNRQGLKIMKGLRPGGGF